MQDLKHCLGTYHGLIGCVLMFDITWGSGAMLYHSSDCAVPSTQDPPRQIQDSHVSQHASQS